MSSWIFLISWNLAKYLFLIRRRRISFVWWYGACINLVLYCMQMQCWIDVLQYIYIYIYIIFVEDNCFCGIYNFFHGIFMFSNLFLFFFIQPPVKNMKVNFIHLFLKHCYNITLYKQIYNISHDTCFALRRPFQVTTECGFTKLPLTSVP